MPTPVDAPQAWPRPDRHGEVLDRLNGLPVRPTILADALGWGLPTLQAILAELEGLGTIKQVEGRWLRFPAAGPASA